jgi:hypothetical protein
MNKLRKAAHDAMLPLKGLNGSEVLANANCDANWRINAQKEINSLFEALEEDEQGRKNETNNNRL